MCRFTDRCLLRDLFKGLWLDSADFEWKTFPVIHLDMGSCVADTKEKLEEKLLRKLQYNAGENNIELTCTDAGSAFEELVQLLAKRDGKVVILVDEYDKPLLGQLGTPGVREIQNQLKTFYGVIKTTEEHQRFALITGVSKFSKVSIFSDLNNLTDLTMNAQFATLLGYTQEELEENFPDYIDALAQKLEKTKEQTLSELKNWYNGYCFEEEAPTVYNPVSVMKCFQELKFKNYWFETGKTR
jgi:cobalamin biosynthesis Mg chelatase CobN